MASREQVRFAYEMRAKAEQDREAAAIAAAREQAALQAQRDAELAAQQRNYAQQQAGLQSQLTAQQNEYERQRMLLSGGLQERRDYLGNVIQQDQMRLGAGLQGQRDTQLSQQRMQEQEHGANVAAQLAQVQLNQQEQMRMKRLEQSASYVDEQVAAGYFTPEEGAAAKHEIVTGLNPLRNRAMEAERLQTQMRTAAMYQQADQQATLFNRQQAIRSMNPQERIREFTDANGNRAMFQLGADGDWSPLDFNAASRADTSAAIGAAAGIQGIQQRAETHPEQLAAMRANTIGQVQQNQFNREIQPLSLEARRLANQNLTQTMEFNRQAQPGNLQHQQLVNDRIQQSLEQGADLHPFAMELSQAQITDLTSRTRQRAAEAPYSLAALKAQAEMTKLNALQAPERFASEQAYRDAQTDMVNAHTSLYEAQARVAGQRGEITPDMQPQRIDPIAINRQAETNVNNATRNDTSITPAVRQRMVQTEAARLRAEVEANNREIMLQRGEATLSPARRGQLSLVREFVRQASATTETPRETQGGITSFTRRSGNPALIGTLNSLESLLRLPSLNAQQQNQAADLVIQLPPAMQRQLGINVPDAQPSPAQPSPSPTQTQQPTTDDVLQRAIERYPEPSSPRPGSQRAGLIHNTQANRNAWVQYDAVRDTIASAAGIIRSIEREGVNEGNYRDAIDWLRQKEDASAYAGIGPHLRRLIGLSASDELPRARD